MSTNKRPTRPKAVKSTGRSPVIRAPLADQLLRWYDVNCRDLPWRASRGKPVIPYHVLVSEFMLQQTQVSTVIPYFHRWMEAFPDVQSLAVADEQDVLRLWQGLGYYSRARNLLKCAKAIVEKHNGVIPNSVEELIDLPGIGRYTAGAIASIGFNTRAPIVDGNVSRVICRLDCIKEDPRSKDVINQIWSRAEEILPAKRVGDFNSALMELGATVCTPGTPKCLLCPLAELCKAKEAGLESQIPPARKSKPVPLEHRTTICIEHDGNYLIERRPGTGRWAGMWQFVTFENTHESKIEQKVKSHCGVVIGGIKPVCTIEHQLTHRRYRFDVFATKTSEKLQETQSRKCVRLRDLPHFPMSRPQQKIAEFLGGSGGLADKR